MPLAISAMEYFAKSYLPGLGNPYILTYCPRWSKPLGRCIRTRKSQRLSCFLLALPIPNIFDSLPINLRSLGFPICHIRTSFPKPSCAFTEATCMCDQEMTHRGHVLAPVKQLRKDVIFSPHSYGGAVGVGAAKGDSSIPTLSCLLSIKGNDVAFFWFASMVSSLCVVILRTSAKDLCV